MAVARAILTKATAVAATRPEPRSRDLRGARALGFYALLLFGAFYYLRPEDYIPGLNVIPWAKITGGIALFALIIEIVATGKLKLPAEIKLLILLFGQMTLAIPFAVW